jgi:UDP-glucuronate 4-epimerase
MKKKYILVTGSAGFIGYHLCKKLLESGFKVLGLDNYDNYYSVNLKKKRTNILKKNKNYYFIKKDLKNLINLKKFKISHIFHLAASAGVRASIKNPYKFIDENISNTIKVFEFAKKNRITKIYYASSSSVYGKSDKYPSKENYQLNNPLSIYGITKITTENIATYYYNIFNISSVGFRFFTVYGPLGRPDMSIAIFIDAIKKNKTILLNNNGNNYRDYTYVDEIIFYIYQVFMKTDKIKKFNKVFNIGGQKNYKISLVVKLLEKLISKKAKKKYLNKLKVDPVKSLSSNLKISKFVKKKFKSISLVDGLKKIIELN